MFQGVDRDNEDKRDLNCYAKISVKNNKSQILVIAIAKKENSHVYFEELSLKVKVVVLFDIEVVRHSSHVESSTETDTYKKQKEVAY